MTDATTEIQAERTGILSGNFHVRGECNFNCSHCFDRCLRGMGYMKPERWIPYLVFLKKHKVEKINIAGGEPFLYPYLEELCKLIKSYGFVVSIVSNGSLITDEWISKLKGIVDWIGLSIDSPVNDDEIIIGRCWKGINHIQNVKDVAKKLKANGIAVKLNITVTRLTCNRDFRSLIEEIGADRVKVFQALTLKGANDDVPDTWSITEEQFEAFREIHRDCRNIVFESNDDIVDSYLMFDPKGRWMTDKGGKKRFYPFLVLKIIGIRRAVNVDKYRRRGGVYKWRR